MSHWGTKSGRELLDWEQPPLHIAKRLAVIVVNHGVKQFDSELLCGTVTRLLPDVSELLGYRYTLQDVKDEVIRQGVSWEKTKTSGSFAYKLSQRVHSGNHYDNWVGDDFYKKIDAAYLEITHQPVSKPLQQRNFSNAELKLAIEIHGNCCYWCKNHFNDICLPVADHYIPISRGGLTVVWNCVPACYPCNEAKGDRMPDDFRLLINQRLSNGRKRFAA